MPRNEESPLSIRRPGDTKQVADLIPMCTPSNPFGEPIREIPELHQDSGQSISEFEYAARQEKALKDLERSLGLGFEIATGLFLIQAKEISPIIKFIEKYWKQLTAIIAPSYSVLTTSYKSKSNSESTDSESSKENEAIGLGTETTREHGDRMDRFIETKEWKENTHQTETMTA